MSIFRIKVAGHVIEIHSLYDRIFDICKKYLTEDEPYFVVHTTNEDIVNERIAQDLTRNTSFPDYQIEVLNVLRKVSDALIDENIVLLHGAAISVQDKGIIFSADSGIGKTVHTIRWMLNYRETVVVNGDKPFVDVNNEPLVCGSPWSGKEGRNKNIIVPLKAIVLMERAEENHIEQVTSAQAFPFLLRQVYRPDDTGKMRKTLRLMQRLCTAVTFYRFQCNNFKDDCFDVAYNALVGGQE